MPLPLALVAIPAVLALLGAKKGYDARSDNAKGNELNQQAEKMFKTAKERLEKARRRCTEDLEELGRLKLDIWDRQLGRFVSLFEQIHEVELVGASRVDQLGADAFSKQDLAKMNKWSEFAKEVVTGGATAVGTGALVGMASYGAAHMLATATTGTAIATLNGVAATNATLAWFGGGALAAGGAGMAGGVAVLGGLVAAPVLAVGGLVLAAKAKKKLAAAEVRLAEAKEAVVEMRAAASTVDAIRGVAEQSHNLITRMDERTTAILDDLETVIESWRIRSWRQPRTWWTRKPNYRKFSEDERRQVHLAVTFAQAIKILLDTPTLTEEGALSETYPKALEHAQRLLSAEA